MKPGFASIVLLSAANTATDFLYIAQGVFFSKLLFGLCVALAVPMVVRFVYVVLHDRRASGARSYVPVLFFSFPWPKASPWRLTVEHGLAHWDGAPFYKKTQGGHPSLGVELRTAVVADQSVGSSTGTSVVPTGEQSVELSPEVPPNVVAGAIVWLLAVGFQAVWATCWLTFHLCSFTFWIVLHFAHFSVCFWLGLWLYIVNLYYVPSVRSWWFAAVYGNRESALADSVDVIDESGCVADIDIRAVNVVCIMEVAQALPQFTLQLTNMLLLHPVVTWVQVVSLSCGAAVMVSFALRSVHWHVWLEQDLLSMPAQLFPASEEEQLAHMQVLSARRHRELATKQAELGSSDESSASPPANVSAIVESAGQDVEGAPLLASRLAQLEAYEATTRTLQERVASEASRNEALEREQSRMAERMRYLEGLLLPQGAQRRAPHGYDAAPLQEQNDDQESAGAGDGDGVAGFNIDENLDHP